MKKGVIYLLLTIFFVVIVAFVRANAAITVVMASSSGMIFDCNDHNDALIRRACIHVHGEEWFKNNIIDKCKYRTTEFVISNSGMMQIRAFGDDVDTEDLLAIKAVFDYMSECGDTLYVDVRKREYYSWYLDKASQYPKDQAESYFYDNLIASPLRFLRIIDKDTHIDPDFGVATIFSFVHQGVYYESPAFKEYKKDCETGNHRDIAKRLKPTPVRLEDIDFYFEYLKSHDAFSLQQVPVHVIPLGISYEYNPEALIIHGTTQIIDESAIDH